MKIMILGGDGFSGWPTSLHLSRRGHGVLILDNLSRRSIDDELSVMSLTPIQPIQTRLDAWREVSGNTIEFQNVDVARHYERLLEIGWCPGNVEKLVFSQNPNGISDNFGCFQRS
jgi:UDP-sulfoquinovose synthase